MSKVLVVAEKPSVARDYARVLKCNQRRDGYIEGQNYIVTWAIGHLLTLAEPQAYDKKYKRWKYDDLPIIPELMKIKVIRKTSKQFNTIKSLMNNDLIEHIICGTDSGREGELIFRYIYQHAKCKKKCYRLWVSSMTDEAITEAFNNIKPSTEYDNLFMSAKCRSEADWLVGINGSRAFSIKHNSLLSIGRVQTPTLAMIVDRQNQIDQFKPQDYYEVIAQFDNFKSIWYEKNKQTKILDIDKAKKIKLNVEGQAGTIVDIKHKDNKVRPPLLYDLTELQREGNRKFGYSAQKVLSIAQNLYEKRKMITYPRTDSRYITHDMKNVVIDTFNKIQISPYKELINNIGGNYKFNNRIINDKKVSDHHAIIPTNKKHNLQSLSKEEYNIYDLIVKRFIAVFYEDYKYKTTEVYLLINNEKFFTKGKSIVQLGWKVVEPNTKNDEVILPKFNIGEKYDVNDVSIVTKATKPPKPYTEATLLSAMEHAGRFVEDETIKEKLKELGLGTPATRAAIIERLIKVGYIKRQKKSLIPTVKGKQLISLVPEQLKSPITTGKWERGLNKISKNEMLPINFMNSIKRYVVFIIDYVHKSEVQTIQEKKTKRTRKKQNSFGKCPICKKGDVLKNSKAYYCSRWKEDCKLTIWHNALKPYGVDITDEFMRKLLTKNLLENIHVFLPQTKEKCVATVYINDRGLLELKNVKRINK